MFVRRLRDESDLAWLMALLMNGVTLYIAINSLQCLSPSHIKAACASSFQFGFPLCLCSTELSYDSGGRIGVALFNEFS